MSKQFIQPKEVSFLNYAIFFDKGSFVFQNIEFQQKRVLSGKNPVPDKWPGGGVGKDKRVKKEALHDKWSFIFQKTEKGNTTKYRNKTFVFWWFSMPEREKLFEKYEKPCWDSSFSPLWQKVIGAKTKWLLLW